MDFARFVDLLVSKSLWLSRVDLMDDPREGLFTDTEFVQLSRKSQPTASIEGLRSLSYVNCWQQSNCESMAMWDLYGAGACGVSIKTTVGLLKAAIAGSSLPIHIGSVKYLDWKRYDGDIENPIGMCVRKAESYRHECEVRLLLWKPYTEPVRVLSEEVPRYAPIDCARIARDVLLVLAGFFPSCDFTTVDGRQLVLEAIVEYQYRERLRNAPHGISISIDGATLIDEVVVGPKAQPWILELARTVAKRYDLGVKVRPSELSAPKRGRELAQDNGSQ
jgi:hypothetical protein